MSIKFSSLIPRRFLKTQDELNASLLFAALNNRVGKIDALIKSGADFRVDSHRAIHTAGNLGYFKLFDTLMAHYDPCRDFAILRDLRLRMTHLENRQDFVAALDQKLSRANLVIFAAKHRKTRTLAAA